MKSRVLDGIPDLTGIVTVSVYDKNSVNIILMCCNTIKRFHKTRQVYDPKTKMVCDAHFFRLKFNDSYNYNMNLVDLSDQL